MILTERIAIGPTDNFESIHDRMAEMGGALLCRTLKALEDGTAVRIKQDGTLATYAKKIEKEDCRIDFSRTAKELDPYIRGLSPIPLAFCRLPDGRMLKVVRAEPTEGTGKPGEVLALSDKGEGGITVATGDGALVLTKVKPEGKGLMTAADLLRGRRVALGDLLGG
jgi:methionyl-tRNA formyltransferase